MRVESVEAHATRASVAPVEVQAQTAVGEEVQEHALRPRAQHPQPDALAQEAPEARARCLAGQEVAARKLPQAAEEPPRRPADREGAAPAHEERGDGFDVAGCRTPPPDRQRLGLPAREGRAAAGEGTPGAARSAGRAERGAELHQRLVQISRARPARELARRLPEADLRGRTAHVLADPEQPGEDACDVPVHDRLGTVERDRGHRTRRVATDAGELAQGLRAVGKPPGVLLHQPARRALEVARA